MRVNDKIGSVLEHKGRVVLSVAPDQSAYSAIAEMTDKGVGALLVMSEGKVIGVIAERDYIRKLTLKGRCSAATRVKEIMSSPVISVGQQCTVDECMTIMTNNHIRHLPVMEDDKVVGMISIGDLVKWVVPEEEWAIEQLESYIAGKYPS